MPDLDTSAHSNAPRPKAPLYRRSDFWAGVAYAFLGLLLVDPSGDDAAAEPELGPNPQSAGRDRHRRGDPGCSEIAISSAGPDERLMLEIPCERA